jgi:hypothetical protein
MADKGAENWFGTDPNAPKSKFNADQDKHGVSEVGWATKSANLEFGILTGRHVPVWLIVHWPDCYMDIIRWSNPT